MLRLSNSAQPGAANCDNSLERRHKNASRKNRSTVAKWPVCSPIHPHACPISQLLALFQSPGFDDHFGARRHFADLVGQYDAFRDGGLFQPALEDDELFTPAPAALDFLLAIADSTHVRTSWRIGNDPL